MQIRLTGSHLEITESLKKWVERKTVKFEQYASRLVECHVILKKEKYYYVAEITLLGPSLRVFGEGQDKENLYTAIEQAAHRVIKQLVKYREKLKSHHLPKGRLGAAK